MELLGTWYLQQNYMCIRMLQCDTHCLVCYTLHMVNNRLVTLLKGDLYMMLSFGSPWSQCGTLILPAQFYFLYKIFLCRDGIWWERVEFQGARPQQVRKKHPDHECKTCAVYSRHILNT